MRKFALDISKNRIGLVVSSDFIEHLIVHQEIINIDKNGNYKQKMKELYEYFKPKETFIGLPSHLSDRNNLPNTNFIKTFAHGIRQIIGKFSFIDENYTTKFGKKNNISKQELDLYAAKIILYRGINYMTYENFL